MADRKISEATPDTEMTGAEKIPLDDGGVAKFATTGQLKDYTLAQLAAIALAQGVDFSADGVYLVKDGAVKPIGASAFGDALLRFAFAKAGASEISGNEVVAIKNGNSLQTATITAIKDWIAENVTLSVDIDGLSDSDALDDANFTIVSQNGAEKKASLQAVKAFVIGGIFAAATADTGVADSDQFLVFKDGVLKKVPRSSAGMGGDVIGPANSTEGNVPQWDSTQKKLKDGLPVATSISANPTGTKLATEGAVKAYADTKGDVKKSGETAEGKLAKWAADGKILAGETVTNTVRDAESAADDRIPTEKAVAQKIADNAGVAPPTMHQQGYVPAWESASNNKLTGGFQVKTAISPQAQASNDALVTEKAVADKLASGVVAPPQSHVEDAVPVWGSANELKAGKSVVTTLPNEATDEQIPTAKAVRDVLHDVTPQSSGLMTASDKTKLDGLVDTGAVAEIGSALKDADTVIVKQSDTVQKKSLLSRFWTYILSKLPTVALDTFAATTDNVNLNATANAHGLLPKLSGNPLNFLSGTGEWTTPPGSDEFTGTDGATDGVHGLVPAPTAADANKFLSAGGTWTTPPSAAGVDIPGATASEGLVASDLAYFFVPSVSGYRKATMAQIRELVMGTKRYDTVFVTAGAMTPSNTDGATPGVITFENTTHDTMAFPSTADKKVEFSVVFPDDWDKGAVKAKLLWTVYDSTKAEAGQHVGFKIGAFSSADGANITVGPTTFVELTDQVDSANELHRTAASAGLEFDGVAGDGNLIHFVLKRDAAYAPAGGSAMPTEAIVLGIVIQYGRTASYTQW